MSRRRGLRDNLAHKRPDSGDLPALPTDGLAPRAVTQICCICNKMRDEQGHWVQPDEDTPEPPPRTLSHGYCPTCAERLEIELGLEDTD